VEVCSILQGLNLKLEKLLCLPWTSWKGKSGSCLNGTWWNYCSHHNYVRKSVSWLKTNINCTSVPAIRV